MADAATTEIATERHMPLLPRPLPEKVFTKERSWKRQLSPFQFFKVMPDGVELSARSALDHRAPMCCCAGAL